MGNVIGPLHWSDTDRLATWRTIVELRADIKDMKARRDPKYNGAIEKQSTYAWEQFSKYAGLAA